MADQSKRERIIEYVVEQIQELEEVKAIKRVLPTPAELGQFAATQFPAVAVVSGWPVPVKHQTRRGPGGADVFLSDLEIAIWAFDAIDDDADTRLSYLGDELWAKLWEDQTRGGLVNESTMSFEPRPLYNRPYVSFVLTLTCRYSHTTGGI